MPSDQKPKRKQTTEAERAAILALRRAGLSYSQISAQEGHKRPTVQKICERAKQHPENPLKLQPRSGRPPKLSKRRERALIRHTLANPRDNLQALATPSKSGVQLHKDTVRIILKRNKVTRCRARKKPFLKPEQKAARLRWAKEHVKWTEEQWEKVVFTDESTFELGEIVSTVWVSRKPGAAYETQNLQPTFKSGRSAVGIWGAICGDTKGPMLVLEKGQRMNGAIYRDEVLKPLGFPFYEKMFRKRGGALWMDDNAKYHVSKAIVRYQEQVGMCRIWWPAQSPDLNPIENIWIILKRRIEKKRHRIHSLEDMEEAIRAEWALLSKEDI